MCLVMAAVLILFQTLVPFPDSNQIALVSARLTDAKNNLSYKQIFFFCFSLVASISLSHLEHSHRKAKNHKMPRGQRLSLGALL